jgi:hypothetical protein
LVFHRPGKPEANYREDTLVGQAITNAPLNLILAQYPLQYLLDLLHTQINVVVSDWQIRLQLFPGVFVILRTVILE